MKQTSFLRQLTEYFDVFLPKTQQRSENTITSYADGFAVLFQFFQQQKGIPHYRIQYKNFRWMLSRGILDLQKIEEKKDTFTFRCLVYIFLLVKLWTFRTRHPGMSTRTIRSPCFVAGTAHKQRSPGSLTVHVQLAFSFSGNFQIRQIPG